jgi:exopolyphosphatase/pppGpp-phosphohydrolase
MHMPHGLCILIAALEACGFDSLTVSGRTNLDGYLLSLDA